ncbi:MAG: hypothetical protein HEP71_14695 [Roseivirga sp.]|nr:hypothetical protein [Roseivirga sp.]
MKKYLIIILLIASSAISWAQGPGRGRMSDEDREKIKAARVAFLTNRLQLTSEVAKDFWPIFNDYEAAKGRLSAEYNQRKRDLVGADGFRNMSDENASKMLDIYLDQKEAELKLEREYMKKFDGVLEARQVWAVIRFEGEFRRDFIDKLRKRGKEGQRGKKGNSDGGN